VFELAELAYSSRLFTISDSERFHKRRYTHLEFDKRNVLY